MCRVRFYTTNYLFTMVKPRASSLYRLSVVSACACHLLWQNVASIYCLTGTSMLPTLAESDVVVCDKRWWQQIEKGDIVVAKNVQDKSTLVCKRVVARQGDLVLVKDGFSQVPPGFVWLEGDNSCESYDSRNYGPIPVDLVQGRVAARIWPVQKIQRFRRPKE